MPTHCRHPRLALLIACVLVGGCTPGPEGGGRPRGGSGGGDPGETGGSGGAGAVGGSGGTGGAATGGTGGSTAGNGGSTAGSGGASPGHGGSGGTGGTGGSAQDGSAPVDTSGADGNPDTGGALPPAVRKVVILHDAAAGASATDPSRKAMVDILDSMKDSHGIVVEMMDSPTKASALMDKALIIVGPNAKMFGENRPDPGLKTLPVPLMVSKDDNTTEIGLGRVSATDPPTFNRITIVKTDHPLAAGLPTGSVVVLTTPDRQRIITFADLGPDAIKIATGPQSATSWALIGYEKGADMGNGLRAPARRVGFFWHRPAGTTAEGGKLFRAAVDWALRPS